MPACLARGRMMTWGPLGYSSSYERYYMFQSGKLHMLITSCVYTSSQEVYFILLQTL